MNNDAIKVILENEPQQFDNIENFKKTLISCGNFNINYNSGQFEGLFLPKIGSNNKLFVCLSGARMASKKTLPHLQRWKWNSRFPGSTLYLSDPSFRYNSKLNLGWYIGTKEKNWLKNLAEIIEILAYKQGLKSSDVVLYGSSAGGFAAMKLTELIEGAVAIAINPQTNVTMYIPSFVKSFLQSNFDTENLEFSNDRLTIMNPRIFSQASKIFLFQNINDNSHYINHYLPFVDYFNIDKNTKFSEESTVVSKLFEGPEGHGPEPGNKVEDLISLSLSLSNNSFETANKIIELL